MSYPPIDPEYQARIDANNAPSPPTAARAPFPYAPYAAPPAPFPQQLPYPHQFAPPFSQQLQQPPQPYPQQPYPQQPYPVGYGAAPHGHTSHPVLPTRFASNGSGAPAVGFVQPANPPPSVHGERATSSSLSSFRPSGRKKALLVGINYIGHRNGGLSGCIRDVEFVYHLLTTKFKFRPEDFVVLTDGPNKIRGVRQGKPTRRGILDALKWLVKDAPPGLSAYFHFSGHGSQVRDKSGDESDGMDETLLPSDYKTAGHIVDDELYDLVRRLNRGARLTCLDACHSGTGMDLPYQHGSGSVTQAGGSGHQPSSGGGLMSVAGALLGASGGSGGALQTGLKLASAYGLGRKKKKKHHATHRPDPNAGEVLCFAGCADSQTSADTSKLSGGLTTGAMTYAFIEGIEHGSVGDWHQYTYRTLMSTMRQKLRAAKLTQVPQFSSSHPFDLSTPFIL